MTEIKVKNAYNSINLSSNDDDLTLDKLYDLFDRASLGLGYHQTSIDSVYQDKVDELNEESTEQSVDLIDIEKIREFQSNTENTEFNSFNIEDSKLRVSLLQEELNELDEAFDNEDEVEIADAYGDILFLAIGGLIKHGYDGVIPQIVNEICNSNLTKFDYTIEQSRATSLKYEEQGIDTYCNYNDLRGVYVTYRSSDGKVLKSCNYCPPNIKNILNGRKNK